MKSNKYVKIYMQPMNILVIKRKYKHRQAYFRTHLILFLRLFVFDPSESLVFDIWLSDFVREVKREQKVNIITIF